MKGNLEGEMSVLSLSPDNAKEAYHIGPCVILFYDQDNEICAQSVVSNAKPSIYSRLSSYLRLDIDRIVVYPTASKLEAELLHSKLPHVVAKRQAGYRALYRPSAVAHLQTLPHYVYQYLDAKGNALYVGCTSNLEKRKKHHKSRVWAKKVKDITSVKVKNRADGLALEKRLIKELDPPFNWRHTKDWDGVTPVCDTHPLIAPRLKKRKAA